MKKILSFLLVFIFLFTLCGCTKQSSDETLRIGLICLHDQNSTYDNNFIEAFKAACEVKGVEYLIKTNISESNDAYNAAAELADSGCSIVFADSFGHEGYIIQAAQEFPNVEFCHATGTRAHTENLPNYHNAFASIYEGRYLAGIAAGMKLNEMIENEEIDEDEAVIGYVGAYSYAEVISGYSSFYLGARSICSSATMKVIFTGSWYDETLEAEAANVLINTYKCVIISGHSDSSGIPNTCQLQDTPFVFYNGSMKEISPDTYIISTKINWQPYFEYIIDCKQHNSDISIDWTGTLEIGSVEMTEINNNVAAEGTKEAIDEVIEKIKNGTLHVFDTSTFTVNGEKIKTYKADVNYDPNYESDTEVIYDGYFHESEKRSAPYFDIQIDGIDLLNAVF